MLNMAGRPGCGTMGKNGGSSAWCLACTPGVPLFCTLFNRGGKIKAVRLPVNSGPTPHKPVYKPHVGPRFVVDLSVSPCAKQPNSKKKGGKT